MATFSEIQTRFLYLIGESSTSSITAIHKSHINYAVKDICNAFPFSWNLKTDTVALSSNVGNLPTDFNPKWGLIDVRVVDTTSYYDDDIFTQVAVTDRDNYSTSDHTYWITYDTSTNRYVFNSMHDNATVTIFYNFIPADMSGDSDVCVVPDAEAVAYLAASKNWVGDERNQALKADYEKEAASRIQALYNQDLNNSEKTYEYSKVVDNTDISQPGV